MHKYLRFTFKLANILTNVTNRHNCGDVDHDNGYGGDDDDENRDSCHCLFFNFAFFLVLYFYVCTSHYDKSIK